MRLIYLFIVAIACASCQDRGSDQLQQPAPRIASDADLFLAVTRTDPFTAYALFPGVDSVTSGTLNGSNAHRPLVRVRMNAVAFSILRGDTLPAGTRFPDGSIIFKEILSQDAVQLYAVMYKDAFNPLAGNGWLWAEYEPDGTTFISVLRQGVDCTSCHARELGPQNDFVRTFERQR